MMRANPKLTNMILCLEQCSVEETLLTPEEMSCAERLQTISEC